MATRGLLFFYIYHPDNSFLSWPEKSFHSLLDLEFSFFTVSEAVEGLMSQDLWCAKGGHIHTSLCAVFSVAGAASIIYSFDNHLGHYRVQC